jgi:hypothetical protein
MNPVKTEQSNVTYTHPAYQDLPARKTEHDGLPAIECCWELSDEELEVIKQTRRVYVSIISTAQPPICVSTIPLPEQNLKPFIVPGADEDTLAPAT